MTVYGHEVTQADVDFAIRKARRVGRHWPRLADEFESVAFVGLNDAALRFDPSRGVEFPAYAERIIFWAFIDCVREWRPRGFKWSADPPPAVGSIHDEGFTHEPYSGDRPAGDDGGFVEEVEAMARRLPRRHAAAFTAYYSGTLDMRQIARVLGMSKTRVSQLVSESRTILAWAYPR